MTSAAAALAKQPWRGLRYAAYAGSGAVGTSGRRSLCSHRKISVEAGPLTAAGYLFGMVGRINQPCIGYVEEPDIDAFHYVDGPKQPTYRVTFHQKDLWEGYQVSSPLCGTRLILGYL